MRFEAWCPSSVCQENFTERGARRSKVAVGSTTLRIRSDGDDCPTELFAKLYARSHLRSGRWFKLARTQALIRGTIQPSPTISASGGSSAIDGFQGSLHARRMPSIRCCG